MDVLKKLPWVICLFVLVAGCGSGSDASTTQVYGTMTLRIDGIG